MIIHLYCTCGDHLEAEMHPAKMIPAIPGIIEAFKKHEKDLAVEHKDTDEYTCKKAWDKRMKAEEKKRKDIRL